MARTVIYTAPIAVGGTMTSEVDLGEGEFDEFAIMLPNPVNYAITASVNVRVMAANSSGGTYHQVYYSDNPSTATSGPRVWEIGVHTTGVVICEALPFARYAKIRTVLASTSAGCSATAATDFQIIARKQN